MTGNHSRVRNHSRIRPTVLNFTLWVGATESKKLAGNDPVEVSVLGPLGNEKILKSDALKNVFL